MLISSRLGFKVEETQGGILPELPMHRHLLEVKDVSNSMIPEIFPELKVPSNIIFQ